mgnify:CR=1 FL=1
MANRSFAISAGALAGGITALVLGTALALALQAKGGALRPADWAALRFTLTQAALSTLLSCLLALPVARALARSRFFGRKAMILLMGAPFLLPVIVAVLGLVSLYGRSGVLNQTLEALGLPTITIYGLHGVVLNAAAAATIEALKELVSKARALKADHNLASRRDVKFFLIAADREWQTVEGNLAKLTRMCGAASLERREQVDGAPAAVTALGTLYLDLASTVDAGAEKVRLSKELDQLSKHIAGTEARLSNEAFVSKAPPAVLDGARIGARSIVGANSLVPQRFTCPPGSMVYGSPAKVVRPLTDAEQRSLRPWAEKYVAVATAHEARA